MKKISFVFILLFIVSIMSCTDDEKIDNTSPDTSLDVNFYIPLGTTQENAPLLTLKNDEVQVTAFGDFVDDVQQSIEKVYISDSETQTEWIVLLDYARRPSFMYSINSFTNEKLPFLYWIENTGTNEYFLRLYAYDWVNRLGTLHYEVKVKGSDKTVIFSNNVEFEGGRAGKKSKSFAAPIPAFEKIRTSSSGRLRNVHGDESPDEQFDRQGSDLMDLLKSIKTELIEAPCDVSKILSKADKNFVCKLSDQLNKVTDEKLFDDFSRAAEETNNDDSFDFEGLKVKFDIDFFKDLNFEDFKRHFNDIRDQFPSNFDFQEWVDELKELAPEEAEDLDDLSDSEGVLQIGLSWNSIADVDLHVIDPSGEEIFYDHSSSLSGGYLDRDDTDGYGPENIYWTENIPDGTYTVRLVYYGPEDGPWTDYMVTVTNALGIKESFTGSLGYFEGNSVTIVSFTKTGKVITF